MIFCLTLLFLAPSHSSTNLTFKAFPRPDLDVLFTPQLDWTWLGGDSSASVLLADSSSLWLFGDSLIGSLVEHGHGIQSRNITRMPHSTLARLPSHLNQSVPSLPEFFIPPTSQGWFSPPQDAHWLDGADSDAYYWLIDGVVTNESDALLLQAMVIVNDNSSIGFSQVGSDLIVVPNFSVAGTEPSKWSYHTARLPHSSTPRISSRETSIGFTCSWNEGIASEGSYVYLLGNCDGSAAMARVLDQHAVTLSLDHMQFWAGTDQGWVTVNSSSTLLAGTVAKLFDSPFTEGTLKYSPELGWYVFLCQAYDSEVRLAFSSARSLASPGDQWIVTSVYTIPLKRRSNGTFSYAAKSHPQLVGENTSPGIERFVFSYNTNAGPGLEALVNKTWVYHPTFVEIELKIE